MENHEKTDQGKKQVIEIKTFPVPIPLKEGKDNHILNINTSSKEQLINQAFKFNAQENFSKALKLHSQGNIKEAKKYYQNLINQGINNPIIFCNYGTILKSIGDLKKAELLMRKAIKIKPDYAEAYSNLGNILIELGNLKEAELSTKKAIKINPKIDIFYYNLGNILKDQGNLTEAILSFQEAIKIKPEFVDAHYNLGIILRDVNKLEDAKIATLKAIKIQPDYAEAHNNLGIIFKDLGKFKEAEESFIKAIKYKKDYAQAYFNLAFKELLLGDYESGLKHYEYRENLKPVHAYPKTQKIKKIIIEQTKKLLVVSEQGLGDTIQYMRYIPYLRDQGIEISFCAQEKLHSLIKASGIDKNPLTPNQANHFSEGHWIPLLSVPRYLKVSPKTPIVSKPYIYSTNKLIKHWENILSKEKKPIIGINWQGNPEMERTYKGRSIPLELFSMLFNLNDVAILSLQKGYGSEQLNSCSFKNQFVNCQPEIDNTWDFLENAAIIENCDLIITSDTSIAHLAGGMGKKVWLLLKDIPYWTWGLKSESTFWYPSMRLFRQKERNNWIEVIERVSNELKKEIVI